MRRNFLSPNKFSLLLKNSIMILALLILWIQSLYLIIFMKLSLQISVILGSLFLLPHRQLKIPFQGSPLNPNILLHISRIITVIYFKPCHSLISFQHQVLEQYNQVLLVLFLRPSYNSLSTSHQAFYVKTYEEANKLPCWQHAMKDEIQAL